jgi:hypothetical protein
MPPTKYMTVDEYAAATGVPARTIRYACKSGRIHGAYKETVRGLEEWRIPADAKFELIKPGPKKAG